MVAIEIADDIDDEHINSSQPLTTIASESQFPDLVRRMRKMKGKGIAMAQHLDLDNSANDATNDGDDDDDEIQIVEQQSSSTLPTVKLNHLGMGTAIKKSTRQPLTCNLLKNLSQTTSKHLNNGVNPLVKRQRQVINSIESETSSVADESTREVLNLNISNNSINANSVQSKKRIRPPRANKKLLNPIGSNKRKPKKPRIADDDPNNPSPFFVLCQAAKMHQNSSANATNECTTSSSENNSSRGSMEMNPGTGTPSSRRLAAAVKLFTKSNTDPSLNAALDKNGTKNSANDQIISEHEHGGQMKNNNNERAAAVVGPRLRQHLQQNAQQQHGPLPSLTTGPSKGTCFTFPAPDFSSSGGNAVGLGRRLIAPSDITTICGQQQPWQLPTSTQRLRIIAAPFEDENVYQTRLRIMTAREARDNLWIAFLEAICNDVTFNQATDANDSEEEKCAKRFDIRFPRECCKYLNDTTVDSLVGVIYKWIDEWMTVDGRPAKELRSFTHSTKNRWALTWAIPQLCIYYLKKSTNISAAEAKRMFLAVENTSITASTAHI